MENRLLKYFLVAAQEGKADILFYCDVDRNSK